MPEIDGLELCRTIRNLPQFQQLPIIMVTAKDSFFDKVQGRLAGATEYLTKPFEASQLLQLVHRFTDVTFINRLASSNEIEDKA
jgi:twitching motility two-component system response regulator PilG